MSNARIGQPVGKVLMTNVAVVRLKKNGKRFEIACYKNKVFNWRNGVETDIDEVLQITRVYENVSKGKFAKKHDWVQAFGVQDDEEVCRIILEQGELQVSEGERKAQVENLYRDIATIVADKCVNPNSNRPYPFSVIERLMKEIHYAVVPNRTAKQQALEVIKKLQGHIPIARAKMKIQVTAPLAGAKQIKPALLKEGAEILEEKWSEPTRMVLLINPGSYRVVDALVEEHSAGAGSLEVIELNNHKEGEDNIDDEISQKTDRLVLSDKRSVAPATLPVPTAQPQGATAAAVQAADGEKKSRQCSTCGGDFGADMQRYREHFRSEWHRYNLKMKAKKMDVVSEDAFNALDPEDVKATFASMTT
ncbi:Sbds family rrna metabolism protein, partial [Globisporangium splendens]